jgi:glutathione S-transferase
MKLFAHPASTCSRKVLTALLETNTAYEFELVDFAKGEHKMPAFMAKQPFGQVPAIDDNGFTLFESRAICKYINEKASGKLVPTDTKQRAVMEQWMSVETSNFTPHAMKFIYHNALGRTQDEATLKHAEEGLNTALAIMDKHLSANSYFVGSDFTLADIGFMPYVEYLMPFPTTKAIVAKYPNVMTWWNRCSERPTWQKAVGR